MDRTHACSPSQDARHNITAPVAQREPWPECADALAEDRALFFADPVRLAEAARGLPAWRPRGLLLALLLLGVTFSGGAARADAPLRDEPVAVVGDTTGFDYWDWLFGWLDDRVSETAKNGGGSADPEGGED